jgi:SpoVK/Ycf46/Vps4 family AAA+-type ATPase
MSGRPRRAAAVEAMAAMQEVGEDPDDSPPVGRRSARARGRAIEESDPSDEEGGAHFVRRSSRAAKPVARLSPDWKGDGEEDEEDETDDEGEYVDESETSEPDPDEEDDAEPKRYSRRERTTIQRYSPPKPAERGGSAEDNAGGARGRGRPAGGGKHASKHASKNGGGFKRANRRGDDDAAPRRGHRWMDDTDDSDVDGETDAFGGAPTLGFPGGGGSLNPWGGAAQNPYPLAPSSYGGGVLPGGGGALGAGGNGEFRGVNGVNGGSTGKDAKDAEITPLAVDPSLTFDQVGGLAHYVHSLKEMVFLPLLYPEVFSRFKMAPPRGVLLYGAPGTGKTLIARALAASCSRAGAEVSFFMRKGADVLSKWVGESERQLRLLFAEAQRREPAIIFFDEIDGLAPVRSSKSDQIHNSIVATLLALMDGLDARGRVVVLGATNRVDAIDGALRRPGRFDRELAFPLPDAKARAEILNIHTRNWEQKPPARLLTHLAERCVGYCGADLKALCTEAAVHALRRRYPQIYESDDKLLIDPAQVVPTREDFRAAMEAITPASHRAAQAHARPLGALRRPLMGETLARALDVVRRAFPPAAMAHEAAEAAAAAAAASGGGGAPLGASASFAFDLDDDDESEDDELLDVLGLADGRDSGTPRAPSGSGWASSTSAALEFVNCPLARQPRLLLAGDAGAGQAALAAALLHELEQFPVHAVGLPSLLADGGRSPEEALVGAVTEARRAAPAVLFLPHLRLWWDSASPTLRATLRALMEDVPGDLPLLLLATCDCDADELDAEAAGVFGDGQVMRLEAPSAAAREAYFEPIVAAAARAARAADARARDPEAARGKSGKARAADYSKQVLPRADAGPPGAGGGAARSARADAATAAMLAEEDRALRQQRMFLRDLVTTLLFKKQWSDFHAPVSDEEAPGYSKTVRDPMDLSTLLWRVDGGWYLTVDAFLRDARLIVTAAKEYWGGLGESAAEKSAHVSTREAAARRAADPEGRQLVSRAHALEDTVREMAGALDPGLVLRCATIARHRAERDAKERGARALATQPEGEGADAALPPTPDEDEPRAGGRGRRGGDQARGEADAEAGAGDKRSREVFAQPGFVADPEVIAREARKKRQREEAAKAAAAKAEEAQEADAKAEAAVTAAAEAAAAEAAGAAVAPAAAPSKPAAAAAAPSGPLPTEEAVKEKVSAIVSALARKTRDAPVADIEATASELGRVAKAAAAASPADKCVAVLEAALSFANA